MKGKLKYVCAVAVLGLVALTGTPAMAGQFDVVFYELTEQATFISDSNGNITQRIGAGSFAGEAKVGPSPLCPRSLVDTLVALHLAKPGHPCYITAIGRETIDVLSGTGTFTADIDVKVQGDNPVDAPELVVMVAHIEGQLQVIDPQQRLIMISGTVMTTHVLDTSTFSLVEVSEPAKQFTGTVRLPFVIEQDGTSRKARRGEAAFYLADDFVTLIPVRSNERSLGLPTARFELNF